MTSSELPLPPGPGEYIELRISDLAEDDRCFGRLDGGMAVLVEGLLAVGDRVRARVLKRKKSHLLARAEEVLEASPVRVPPACTHFGSCGGCKWQHVSYEEQVHLKGKKVADALAHIGGFAGFAPEPVVHAPQVGGYRNKMEFSFTPSRFVPFGEDPAAKPLDFALGLYAPRQFLKVVDIDTCTISPDAMNTVLRETRQFAQSSGQVPYSTKTHEGFWRHLVVRTARDGAEMMVNIVTSWYDEALMNAYVGRLLALQGVKVTTIVNNLTRRMNNVAMGEEERVLYGSGLITEELDGLKFQISANSFFQTNSRQAEVLYQLTMAMAEIRNDDLVLDLYCGTGSITLFAARHARHTIGIELVESAIRDAKSNAKLNGVANAEFHAMDLKDFGRRPGIPGLLTDRPRVVIVDPPRAGLHPKLVSELLALAPERMVYVSCNPASLARDAKLLCEGGYRLERVVPVDMFPHTNHIESVAVLTRLRPSGFAAASPE